MGFEVMVYALLLLLIVLLVSKSKSSGFVNPVFQNQANLEPTYVGKIDDQNVITLKTEVNVNGSNWQTPTMAFMLLRRLLGVVVASGVFILLNPIGEETNFWGILAGIFLGFLAGVFLNPGNLFNVPFRQYIKWYRLFSFRGQSRQVMSFEGEAGWQPKKRLPGWRYIIVAWNDIAYFPFTEVPSDAVWYIHSRIGETLPSGRKTAKVMKSLKPYEDPKLFMSEQGQLNIQRTIITPGYLGPIDLIAFQVDDGTQEHSSKHKEWYKPYRVADDKFAMVTCLDSAYQLPEGAIFARVGGFYDIQKKIAETFGPFEADLDHDIKKSDTATDIPDNVTDNEESPSEEQEKIESENDEVSKVADTQHPLQYIFRKDIRLERTLAGECLRLLLKGPQEELEDYQNMVFFDEMKGTVGPHWRLIKPGRLLNLNRFVFDVTPVAPFKVEAGTCKVLILSTGVLARDVTRTIFPGGRIVRMGGNGINLKALEPSQYSIPSDLLQYEEVPIRQFSLYFGEKTTNKYDAKLNRISARTPSGVVVEYDLNVLLTIPAESASLIVAAFGNVDNFISEIAATHIMGETMKYIRDTAVHIIVSDNSAVLGVVKRALRESIEKKYGVIIHGVKLEYFNAVDYLDELQKKSVAEAEKTKVIAQTATAEENKKLQTALGEAKANLIIAVARGNVKAVELAFSVLVDKFGEEGATLIQALKEMTGGEHPFMPQVLGLSTDGSGGAGGYMPVAAMLNGLVEKYAKSDKVTKKPTESKKEETSEIVLAVKDAGNITVDEKKEESKTDSEKK